MNNDLINELYSKIDNQEKIIVDLQKNNSGITLEEHVRVLNAYQELQEKYNKQKEVIDKANKKLNNFIECCKAEKLESGSDYIHHQYWDMLERFNK